MDLSTIQMHLDNFVNTWEGWHKVVEGLSNWVGIANAFDSFKTSLEVADAALPALSSN
ncbi:hypothetical protein ACLI1L_002241 [Corynebacterium sp. LaCa117]|uniref:Uncharacterized protein n=1 Tax=Corynebacterium tuberculostearicum SK141 TaxID=553206 RepID=C6RC84_9CORY|nr:MULTISPECIES: hypothetical protein [Corynebacterium]EET76360.1 hypothetical protein CORTU0001_0134 [Corynebacterium tuberculostearicum SK141]MCG7458348.1 hypothetical protein [Corynebacterium tuberculostearicum]